MIPDYSGKLLAERYLLRRRIGYGGMATVYEAVDRELNKPVAVKILNPHYASQSDYLARFRQEAREAARIRHENLVDVTDQGSTADGLAFFVMEFLRGETLQNYLHPSDDESRPVAWRTVLAIVAQVCDALQHAHEHGVIHRDIKPGNIFLVSRRSGEFRVKVLDLGIAKVLQGHRDPAAPPTTRASQGTPGTPEYMSPEQVRGAPNACPQTDIYAVGVMMYRMLTGTLPFYSELSPFDVMEQHCKQVPELPRKRAPSLEIPEVLEREVMRALGKRPEDRQASAQELADTLRNLEAIEARRERMLREDDEARTLQYHLAAGPVQRTLARWLSYLAAGLGGLTLSVTLFMVLVLLPFIASQADDPPRRGTAVSVARAPTKTRAAAPAPDKPSIPEPAPEDPTAAAAAPVDPSPPDPPAAPAATTTPPSDPPSGTPTTPAPEDPDVEVLETDTGDIPPSEPDPSTPTGTTAPDTTPTPPSEPAPGIPPPSKPIPPEKQLAEFLRGKKRLLNRRCGQVKIFSKESLPVGFELAPNGGLPVSVLVSALRRESPLGKCVAAELRKLEFPPLTRTTFKSITVTF